MEQFKIPGYEEAIACEKDKREEAFLGSFAELGGVPVYHITPRLLVRLSQMRSPFVAGGIRSEVETMRFMFAIWKDYVPADHSEYQERILMLTALLKKRYPDHFLDLEDEIEAFVKVTFMDGPMGGGSSVPYVSGIAWNIFQMSKQPWEWDMERTMDTPYRVIFQLQRCAKLERGDVMFNESDWVKDKFLHDLREGRISGQN